MPWLSWSDPVQRFEADGGFDPPMPELWIGCGRRSVPLTIAAKKRHRPTFTVQIQNPRARLSLFDLVIPPVHDQISGPNVFSILGSPNRFDPEQLQGAMLPAAAMLPRPLVAVLIGGRSRSFDFNRRSALRLVERFAQLASRGAGLVVTTSRRTPAPAAEILCKGLDELPALFWRAGADPETENPYPAMLAEADHILVTEDSVNLATEAAASGKPVHILPLARKAGARAAKFDRFHDSLRARGVARLFDGELHAWRYEPLNETARAAAETVTRWRG